MGAFFVKDFLVYWRDRKEMLISLIAPLAIIFILSAMPDWTKSTTEVPEATLAVVMEDSEEEGLQQFRERLAALPPEVRSALSPAAERLLPVSILMEALTGEEVAAFLTLTDVPDRSEAMRMVEEKEADAALVVPAGYTKAALEKMLLDEGEVMPLSLTALSSTTQVQVVQGVIEEIQRTMNFHVALGRAGGGSAEAAGADAGTDAGGSGAPEAPAVGGREMTERYRSMTMFQYYTSAIAILFVLFIAETTAAKAGAEKREHVLRRIMLSGSRPISYLIGKIGSTFCLAVLQMVFIFTVCHFIVGLFPDRSAGFWLGLAAIIAVYCFCVACLAGLFTSITFRMRDGAAGGVLIMIVTAIGTIGGNFVPIYILPDWLRSIGSWTPNGRALAAYIQWLQQESLAVIAGPLLQLAVVALLAVAAGIWLFPRRGQI